MPDPLATPSFSSGRRDIVFLDLLRGPAALLVVWDHLVGIYHDRTHTPSQALTLVRTWVNEPFGIIQDFGWLGVCLFFLISGFVITHVAQRESASGFAVRRLFRIYPVYILSVIVWALISGVHGGEGTFGIGDALRSALLLNYWRYPQVVINGVGWTLAIEMLFYTLVYACYSLVRRPLPLVAVELVIVATIIATARSFGDSYFLFASSAAYIPYLIVGQLLYFFLWMAVLHPPMFIALLAATGAVLVSGLKTIHTEFLPLTNSYLISFAYAIVVFLLALGANAQMRRGCIMTWLADHSYSIYLFHGVIGFALLDRLTRLIGYRAALIVALAAIAALCALTVRFVERPGQRLGRRIARRWSPKSPAAP